MVREKSDSPPKNKVNEKISFEEALKQLEEIVNQLESGELGLEDSLKYFERGINLSRFCEKKLKSAERKIEMLSKNENGKEGVQAVPFEFKD